MSTSKIQRAIKKREQRRLEEREAIRDMEIPLHEPVKGKQLVEHNFDKDDKNSFQEVIDLGNRIVEKKGDGHRTFVSVDRKNKIVPVKLFTKSGNELDPACFPEVVADLKKDPTSVREAELLGYGDNLTSLEEYDMIVARAGLGQDKITSELLKKFPLKLDVFDILRLEDETLLTRPLEERTSILRGIEPSQHVQHAPQWHIDNLDELYERFLWAVDEKDYEGLIAKDPNSLYVPGDWTKTAKEWIGNRGNNDWLKLKLFTTFDLIILGFYETDASRKAGRPFSGLLVGAYNTATGQFETIVKVGLNGKKAQDEIYGKIKDYVVRTDGDFEKVMKVSKRIVINPAMKKIKKKIPNAVVAYPDDSVVVAEIKALDVTYSANTWHSCGSEYYEQGGHSLRLPSYVQLRTDKTHVKDVTSTEQLHDYYEGNV